MAKDNIDFKESIEFFEEEADKGFYTIKTTRVGGYFGELELRKVSCKKGYMFLD